jgi:tRNA uridine 5-carboxymethylaminomethyl modification enzyme
LQLKRSFESKLVDGLFFAGQVNGSSGYEEAAAQGLYAGINAALKIENKKPLIITRNQGYIGVLIDDLVTKGTNEPYRMLTSRAEYRLLLRNDNADERLTKVGFDVNLISQEQMNKVNLKYESINNKIKEFTFKHISPNSVIGKKYKIVSGTSILQLILRPDVNPSDFTNFKYIYELTTRVRLKGYIDKQNNQAKKMLRLEHLKIPLTIDYSKVQNLATEARQKLSKIKPTTIGQATRISGINPADIQMLMYYLNSRFRKNKNEN